jgi:hypothetical protein
MLSDQEEVAALHQPLQSTAVASHLSTEIAHARVVSNISLFLDLYLIRYRQ